MKNHKRIWKLARNTIVLLLLFLFLWLDGNFAPADRLGRLTENYMLAEPEFLSDGLGNERLYRLDGEIVMLSDKGGTSYYGTADRPYSGDLHFFRAHEDITVFPSMDYGGFWGGEEMDVAFYAVGEVPGAAYAEGELRLSDWEGAWAGTYPVSAQLDGEVACFVIEHKYADGDQADAEQFIFDDFNLCVVRAATNEPVSSVTLRYYAADGTLLAEFEKALTGYDTEYSKNGFTVGALVR